MSAARVEDIIKTLETALDGGEVIQSDLQRQLAELKVIARDPAKAPQVYGKNGLKTLSQVAFDSTTTKFDSNVVIEAASIIGNVLLLRPKTQEWFAEFDYNDALVRFYGIQEVKHEFVGARILFLLTYNSSIDFDALLASTSLGHRIMQHLSHHVNQVKNDTFAGDQLNQTALTETAKLVYSLVSQSADRAANFVQCSAPIIALLNRLSASTAMSEGCTTSLINALAAIDWSTIQEDDIRILTTRLVSLLQASTNSSTTGATAAQVEAKLVPLVVVLRKIVHTGERSSVRELRERLLPADAERDKPLGTSDSLPSRLLRLQLAAAMPNLSEAVSGLLFDLSDRNALTFVRNIGYGHAAGYLMKHNIPAPDVAAADTSFHVGGAPVNPITGQRIDAETQRNSLDMSDAEKEREAERLFVLFERLKKTGVVNVENPVTAAKQSGRLEELPDDAES